eukprot:gene35939-46669_t
MSSGCFRYGEADTFTLPIPLSQSISVNLKALIDEEISFNPMLTHGGSPVPRLVSIQSISMRCASMPSMEELSTVSLKPLYRHPNDSEPPNNEMTPFVLYLRNLIESVTGITQLNHVLIQKYRDGKDNIQMHSDKTLDLSRVTPIINLSIGAERIMKLRRKNDKSITQLIPLIHGEVVVFGIQTNQFWYHEVPKKLDIIPHPDFGEERISFTFRKVETFLVVIDGIDTDIIIGQGSPFPSIEAYVKYSKEMHKLPATLETILTGVSDPLSQSSHLLDSHTAILEEDDSSYHDKNELFQAFSKENKLSDAFDWQQVYGKGFLCR